MLITQPRQCEASNSAIVNESALSLTQEKNSREATDVLKKFWNDESGATAVEYGLIGSLIAIAIIGGFSALASSISILWGDNNSSIGQAFQ
jgi:pilus assembly protein Flp/PilA